MSYYLNQEFEEVMACKSQGEDSVFRFVHWAYKYMYYGGKNE